jgi:hypothetical protein
MLSSFARLAIGQRPAAPGGGPEPVVSEVSAEALERFAEQVYQARERP